MSKEIKKEIWEQLDKGILKYKGFMLVSYSISRIIYLTLAT